MELNIITPAGAFGRNNLDDSLDEFLRCFAEKYSKDKGEWAEKYGTNFENDKFMMHPFCWCERDDCKWCSYENEEERLPNFWYKPLDFKVNWYKYIGRSVETNKQLSKKEFKQMLKDAKLK